MTVRVVTDSGCDLPGPLAVEHGISVVPLSIRFGDEQFDELDVASFWSRLTAGGELPQSAAPSPGAFAAVFRQLARDGADGIVCINLSARLSGTLQAATIAARDVVADVDVRVVDSATVSMGLGALCIGAAEHAPRGAALDAVVADVVACRELTQVYATLDTLEFLRRGGRIGSARALLGSMLSVKPLVEVRDGVVESAGQVRTRSRALRALAAKVAEQPVERLCVLHGNAPDVDELVELLRRDGADQEILTGIVGPVIGTHAGPGVLGVAFQARAARADS